QGPRAVIGDREKGACRICAERNRLPQSEITETMYYHDCSDGSPFDPHSDSPERRGNVRDCIHGRHARKCPECDLVIELRESDESARKLIRLARRAVALWHERPFEDCPLNQIMNMVHVAAVDLAEHFPDEPDGSAAGVEVEDDGRERGEG